MSKSKKTPSTKTPKTAKPAAKRTKAKADAVASLTGPTLEQSQAAAEAIDQAPENAPAETPAATTKVKKAPKEPKTKKPSGLDLIAQVLKDKGEPMGAKEIAEAVIAAGWQTKGKTPAATLYSAMLREIDGKPSESRFVKTGRGLFALTNGKA
jgi:hypothetical protein